MQVAKDRIYSPFDGRVVGEMPLATEAEVEAAVGAAVASFQTYRRLPRFVRADILQRASELLGKRREEAAALISAEAGKPLYDARGEVARSIFNLSNAAAEARRIAGVEIPLDMDGGIFAYQTTGDGGARIDLSDMDQQALVAGSRRVGLARRFPIGPVLAIAPFNFPLNLVLHKVAPALAVGNSVVLKPAPQTPLTSVLLAEILTEAGLPDGVLNVVHCAVPLAEKMVRDDRFHMVTFTGSAPVGWHIKSIAGKKKVALELGGNAAVIVCADADLELAAARCVRGGVVYGGQYCIGVQRILVHESVRKPFQESLVRKLRDCKVGDPALPDTDVGPVIDQRSAARIKSWIDEAVEAGARIVIGGGRANSIVEPTLLAGTKPGMKVEDEEIFGPVMTINSFERFGDAVSRANATRYGLQGGLFTRDLRQAFTALEDWDVGGLMINDVPIYRIDNMPFGGWKESGIGREGTRFAMEEMSELKHLVINYH
ncbi:aldehyde dehydrogenase family protein [Mesorhizobium sp. B2-3-4]|uniref:aldehyde dehydrogenase family protein n=1 Tax=Mesorhizobium sp. B2-3-4 TaxID=2589959 RepID=UPI0011261F28|nr:aldehyde dehydrogenase family protein [Mesorhizobium sp. B2-3-4]TPM40499.1 aldehyde dehydrogenase family protein [Mesorhizobium sp. B2-3-4]